MISRENPAKTSGSKVMLVSIPTDPAYTPCHFTNTELDDQPLLYGGRGKFMPLPLKSKILETPGSLVTDDIKMFPL